MIKISLSPQRNDSPVPEVVVTGRRIRINGELFNFNSLNDGDIIQGGDIPSDWFVGDVKMIDDELQVRLLLPHGANPESWQAFPDDIYVEEGTVDLPTNTRTVTEGSVTTIYRWGQEPEYTHVES